MRIGKFLLPLIGALIADSGNKLSALVTSPEKIESTYIVDAVGNLKLPLIGAAQPNLLKQG